MEYLIMPPISPENVIISTIFLYGMSTFEQDYMEWNMSLTQTISLHGIRHQYLQFQAWNISLKYTMSLEYVIPAKSLIYVVLHTKYHCRKNVIILTVGLSYK